MARKLIYADDAIKALKANVTDMENYVYYTSNLGVPEDDIEEIINELPTVDAVEVVHGEWEVCEDDWNEEVTYKCSNCGDELVTLYGFEIDWNYCPNCGAKMDGEK